MADSADYLLAQMNVHFGQARTVLVAGPRSDVNSLPFVESLHRAADSAGVEARVVGLIATNRLVEARALDAERDGTAPSAVLSVADLQEPERAMRTLRDSGMLTLLCGKGLLDDSPTLLATRIAEAMVLVVRRGKSRRSDVQRALTVARDAGIERVGTVVML